MYCPKCSSQSEDGSAFCPKCGYNFLGSKDSQMTDEDITMVIPVIREREDAPVKRSNPPQKANPKVPCTNKSEKKIKIMTFAIAFLATLLVGLAVIAIILIPKGTKRSEEETKSIQTPVAEKEPEEEKEETELQEGKSEGREEKRGIYEESDFSFALGKTVETKEFSSKTLNNTEFGYSCDVPSDFVFLHDTNSEIRYCAQDNTAYIDVGAFQNDDDLTAKEIKEMLSSNPGGTSDYEIDGDNWFTLRKKAGGIVHYFKCYVDSVVRYVEFAYPQQYADVYDEYVREIEPTFVKTN